MNVVWIVTVVSLTAGHFMFIHKNSSSLHPRAVLRGPWFRQSASGCTMTFWWKSLPSLDSLMTTRLCRSTHNFRTFFLSALSAFFLFHSSTQWIHNAPESVNVLIVSWHLKVYAKWQIFFYFSTGWLEEGGSFLSISFCRVVMLWNMHCHKRNLWFIISE